jgi:hypothetical protein
MDTLAIATVAGSTGPQQLLPPPEPVQAQQQPQFTSPLPQHAASAQQSPSLHQTPPRPVEDTERNAGRDARQGQGGSSARNRNEGKGMRLDLRA